jgi:hypothetical protein
MAYYKDLERCDYFSLGKDVTLIAVGWLERERHYSTGSVTGEFYQKLQQLLINPWSVGAFAGYHECSLCQFEGAKGTNNLFVPHNRKIYVTPELVLHYINCHNYRPPDEFIEGVLKCPSTRSMEYKKSILENGGRNLVKLKVQNNNH